MIVCVYSDSRRIVGGHRDSKGHSDSMMVPSLSIITP